MTASVLLVGLVVTVGILVMLSAVMEDGEA